MGRNDGIMYDKTDTIIDSHVHVYPDELALKTYQKLSEVGGNVEDSVIGNLKALNEMMSRLNINKVIVQHIATKPESVDDVMDFALSIKNDKILAFAPLHPFEENIFSRIGAVKKQGFLGIKLHPYFQRFGMDDRALYPFFEAAESAELPVLIHAGKDHMYYDINASDPEDIAKVQKDFPSLKIIAAHMGGMLMSSEAQKHIIGSRIYIDTALSYKLIPKRVFSQMIKDHDPDRILFASDFPWSDPQKEINNIKSLDISDDLKQKIFCKNAVKLYDI